MSDSHDHHHHHQHDHGDLHSTGRGGQGNIGRAEGEYAEAGIIREGPAGDQGSGPFSSGRGGAGNIGSPQTKPQKDRNDQENITELDMREHEQQDYHVGRGGAGNAVHDHKDDHEHESLGDKLKHKILHK